MSNLRKTSPTYLLILVLLAGCQSLRAKSKQDFITPIGSSAHASRSASRTEPKSERELCIRTAETVGASGHFIEAIKLYEKAENLGPGGEPLHDRLAPLYAQAGEFENSISRYQAAIAEDPENAELANNYAWTLLQAGQTDAAIAALQSALTQSPNDRRLAATRAIALYRQGDRSAARAQFTTLYGSSAAHHNLAMLDLESGNEVGAKSEVAQALAASPSKQTIELANALNTVDEKTTVRR